MLLKRLSSEDVQVIRSCILYILERGQLGSEFQTRIGVEEQEVRDLLKTWPEIDDIRDDSVACLAINNALNEVCHGIRISDADWQRWFSMSRFQVREVYDRWAKSRGWKWTGIR